MRNMAFITLILISLVTISSPYSSFGGFMAWEKVTSFSLENATWPSFNGASYSGSSPTSQTTKTEHSPLSSWTSQCPDPGVTIESSYSDILELLQRKFSLQIQNTSAGVLQLLKESYQSCCKGLKNFAENTILFLLRSVLKAWLTFLCGMGLGLFGILIIGFWPVMGLVLCLAITIALVRGCKWIFSEGLWPLIALPWKTFSMILSYKRSSHLKSDKGYEKLIEGFQDFSIPVENTPRSSSLLIIDKSREGPNHVGYGTCIRLVNGLDALILPTHLVGSDSYVASSRNGNMIALSDFSPLRTPNEKTDFAIYYGPPNWESKLGVKAATVKTARQLSKGPVSFYTFKDGQWTQKGAFISGVDGLFATTLSNTQPGHSGVGFYSGKTIVGIHSGHSIQHNYNKMIIIPDLPGLTCTDLVYESPLAREKLLAQQQMEALDREYQEELKEEERREVAAMKDFEEGLRRKGKKVWADEGYEILPTVPTSSELSVSPPHSPRLNRDSGTAHNKNRPKGRPHPAQYARFFRKHYEGHAGNNAGKDQCGGYCGGDQENGFESLGEGTSNPATATQERETWRKQQTEEFRKFFQTLYFWDQATRKTCTPPGFRFCGKIEHRYQAKEAKESGWGESLCSIYPALKEATQGFGWPEMGTEAELKSLNLQASRWLERAQSSKIPSDSQREHVIQRTTEAFSNVTSQSPQITLTETLLWENFMNDFRTAVQSLELDAGIGLPYVHYGLPTHRGWVEDKILLPVLAQLTFDRLKKMSEASFETLSPEELVKEGLCDPVRLFVKREPHKLSKLIEGRYRLIMSISLVDQLVARILFQDQNKLEIALWRAIPSKPGFGLSTDEQITDFVSCLSKQCGVSPEELIPSWEKFIVPTDCSGFDWSVSEWMLKDEMEVRNRLTRNATPLLRRLRACWLKCLCNSVLALTDGTMLAQVVPGVQKSGSYNTSSSNSRIRVMAAYHTGASWAMAMGDDALESPDGDLSVYKELGFKVEVSRQLEFCSHIFKSCNLAVPVNVGKMLYKLIHSYEPERGNLEVLAQYMQALFSTMHELRHDPELVADLISWLTPSGARKL
uniref:RNA-dependent RNA polymerase P1-P2 protein n=1 Tax=Cynanchum yellow mottle-associated virus TaxID=2926297 RepID=A0AA48GBW4_9VIRU|nr:RNA-dependent RNA polymerase P1-P2 protein [Cynanchum yellow mottle-associated virus]